MSSLPFIDLTVIVVYLAAMLGIGFYSSRRNKSSERFMRASGAITGWAVGLSIYATFLSSNTFLGVPGKAFGTNWNAFVFSLSMPFAAWVASKYFVRFYRSSGEVSAYTHLEHRFGAWARTYAVICFLLTQVARMGSIFFGIALSLQALTGLSMQTVMIVMGVCIIVYTVLGGIEAVIWTEVIQAVIKTFGAVLILYLVIRNIPGGVGRIIDIGHAQDKFSLGSFSFNLTDSTFWVVLLYGFFINLNNFGVDQNYIQRYHTASSATTASKSIWLCVWLYVPVSLLFFVIGSALFAYYQVNPELLDSIRLKVAAERLPGASIAELKAMAASLAPADYGDKIMPHFMVTRIPAGLTGLIVSAILSAAMSTISSGMNASATVFSIDIWKRYVNPEMTDKKALRLLHVATVVFGLIGMGAGIAMIGVKSILDTWWELSGIFAAGMLGLFLLGLISKRTSNHQALIAAIVGLLVIFWMALPALFPEPVRILLHKNLIIVIGTLTIFLVGVLLSRLKSRNTA